MDIISEISEWLKTKITVCLMQPLLNRRKLPRSWETAGAVNSFAVTEQSATFSGSSAELSLTLCGRETIRVIVRRPSDPPYQSFCLAEPPQTAEQPPLRVQKQQNRYLVKTPLGHEISVNTSDFRLQIKYKNNLIHQEPEAVRFAGEWVSAARRADCPEKYLGFGEKSGPLFKNGANLVMWNTDNSAWGTTADPLYQSCPLMIALGKSVCGLFFDNGHWAMFQPGDNSSSPHSWYYCEKGPLCYYLLPGPNLKSVLRQFTELTGHYPLPPLWALGHHHSRWIVDESAEKLIQLADSFRAKSIPCDALHIDIGHLDGYRCFSWHPERFNRPQELLRQLKQRHLHSVVIVNPCVKKDPAWPIYQRGQQEGFFVKDPKGGIYTAPAWPGLAAFFDFASSEAATYWGELHKFYLNYGIDGFWNDMNEPSVFIARRTLPDHLVQGPDSLTHKDLHNLYALLMNRASYEGIRKLRPEKRPFLLTRSGWAGVQKYACSWTGDSRSTWQHLAQSIPMLLNMGLSGQVMVGADIGGFWGKPSKELFIRWLQLGSFYPFCRNHTDKNFPHQEIWNFDSQTEEIGRKYLRLRYSLLPYFYTCLRECSATGLPLMQPLLLAYPDDAPCYNTQVAESQFLIGSRLLVAPVLKPGAESREVYLPGKHTWINWWTGERLEAGKTYQVWAPLSTLPLFVRSDTVLATTPAALSTAEIKGKPLILLCFPEKTANGSVYIDDGESLAYADGKFSLLNITLKKQQRQLSITIERTAGELLPLLGPYASLRLDIWAEQLSGNIREVSGGTEGRPYQWEQDPNWLKIFGAHQEIPAVITVKF